MASEAAVLLDQLMGLTRNAVPGDNAKELSWEDDEVCKSYLCGFCPSDLFTNTKAELGPCYKVHDDRLKKLYEESGFKGERGFEDQFLAHLERLVMDLDKKIIRGKERLQRSADAKQQALHGEGPGGKSSDKLKKINLDIDSKVLELKQLGELGKVDQAQALMTEIELLEKERNLERLSLSNTAPKILAGFELDSNDFHEKMELCDVCGSFLVIGDTQSRVDAHLMGKQHIGFARIRAAIEDLRQMREERSKLKQEERLQRIEARITRSPSRERRRSHRSRSRGRHRKRSERSRSREGRSVRSRSRERDRRFRNRRSVRSRSRERNRRSRSRDKRSRSRERDRRSRSIERKRKRSRSREKRSKSRDRKRSRSREKRSRSRDRRRSRSRDRKRSRSRDRKRSRSRDRKRSRSGDRRRSRSRDRKRSRSRDRKRSRSRDRRRSTSRDKKGGGSEVSRTSKSPQPSQNEPAKEQNAQPVHESEVH